MQEFPMKLFRMLIAVAAATLAMGTSSAMAATSSKADLDRLVALISRL